MCIRDSIANFHPSQIDDERALRSMRFFREACLVHSRFSDYLGRGELLGFLDDFGPTKILCVSCGVYTRPGKEHIFTRTVPSALASIWALGDGRALVLANHSTKPVRINSASILGFDPERTVLVEPTGDGSLREGCLESPGVAVGPKHIIALETKG